VTHNLWNRSERKQAEEESAQEAIIVHDKIFQLPKPLLKKRWLTLLFSAAVPFLSVADCIKDKGDFRSNLLFTSCKAAF
jgi:hypothetical protein